MVSVYQSEPGCPEGWLKGLKPRKEANFACMPGSWKDSMKDGSHCQGQLWQCQFDVLSSRAPHSLFLTAPSWYSCASWWFSDANSHMAKWFSPLPLHPPPSAAGAWVPPTACLSQRVWKLAGEEVLACANYILIIGNVLANQALIAILEPSTPLCRLRMGDGLVGLECGWAQTCQAGHLTLHNGLIWRHAWPTTG